MRISTRGVYGIMVMMYLANVQESTPVSLREIASKLDLSEKYLEQMVSGLRAAGLVKSIKGSKGGYVLAKKKEYISASDILYSTEGQLILVDQDKHEADLMRDTLKDMLWEPMTESILKITSHTKLSDLVKEWNYRQNTGAMYYI